MDMLTRKRRLMQHVQSEQRVLAALLSMQSRVEIFPERFRDLQILECVALHGLTDQEAVAFRARWVQFYAVSEDARASAVNG